ncbi:hypothetical protein TPASS_0281 [Treponema pallidum subsp. pallidum SS14]|uniref:Uncharacterized protein TP_0281 n=2 Tax=Treponema pallidum subsp. pallidum TaxID=161 RepID=Y281_TREPA|nr:RecName: Full=Uncharacterized protein TP_0281 [Treponema pallidum subsp. pallidum str. Nichols]AAC65278.1 predicted coding region TP0281 [Treponema pallidum subsp. pallidum str. Nichols]ACD70708.1 hypothetical protein TPASS_0281 [Treponema pallidum subsp. pallidum SS14]ADD72418.1 conserved hypothetical protein [Treponema pallidum subsp. pallidum str. Chicago]
MYLAVVPVCCSFPWAGVGLRCSRLSVRVLELSDSVRGGGIHA